MDHTCIRADEFDQLKKIIYGNGRPGLLDNMTRLQANFDNMEPVINDIRTSLSGIQRYIDISEGAKKQKDTNKNTMRWLIGVNITVLIFLVGIIIELIK